MFACFDLIGDNLGGSDDGCPRQSRRPPPLSTGDKTTTVKNANSGKIIPILSPTLSPGHKTNATNISSDKFFLNESELEFVNAVTGGGSVKFLPAV